MDYAILLTVPFSVTAFCMTWIFALKLEQKERQANRHYTDHAKLSLLLETKLKEMDTLKQNMESLLLKNGFGRK